MQPLTGSAVQQLRGRFLSERTAAGVWPALRTSRKPWTLHVAEPERDDHALVQAAQAGDTQAFEEIVERHRRSVYSVCYRFVSSHEDASDLAQETFVRAWKGLGNFKGESAFSTWLYRIAVNTSLNRVSARRLPVEPIEGDKFVDTVGELPGASLIREERAQAVRRAIAALPEKQRATLILRAYHDMSHQEIADVLGSSVGAVKANFFHALANLRKILGSEP
jgi:RNA polymerase sigma-70 factor (ECF subfamily)